jgi:hypothetical protein
VASSDTAANESEKTSAKGAATRRAASKPRPTAHAKSLSTLTSSSSKRSERLPKWLVFSAIVTGAVVAVTTTAVATRNAWLPRKRKSGEWIENPASEQPDETKLPAAAPEFEPSGASAGFAVDAAAR